MIRVRLLVLCAATAFLFSCSGKASAPPTAEEINALWQQGNDAELDVRLSENLAQAHPDFIGIYCARTFFILVRPDKTKAVKAALKMKQCMESTKEQDLIKVYATELAEVQAAPEGDFSPPSAAIIEMLHSRSRDKYMAIDFGLNLKARYFTP